MIAPDLVDGSGNDSPLAEVVGLVERAEALAWSTEWRKGAKEFRQLRERWEILEHTSPGWARELTTRFRAAQQTFMDRRADFFNRGNIRKGAGLLDQLEGKQVDMERLTEELNGYHAALRDFSRRLAETSMEGHGLAIRAFIGESITNLQAEIQRKERDLAKLERSMVEISSRYYCVE
ncbi:hypothetical protein SIID45300_01499 [Candidatus Magnetaquicoccaceae bacterium FCR-1]|uniref:DUF349 domain-containing protein n=1 Tax=Candidatus Magnetaquiglobus chichijimensis TaxID=3141448 RepID=A0ABQ0C8G7_9PROT